MNVKTIAVFVLVSSIFFAYLTSCKKDDNVTEEKQQIIEKKDAELTKIQNEVKALISSHTWKIDNIQTSISNETLIEMLNCFYNIKFSFQNTTTDNGTYNYMRDFSCDDEEFPLLTSQETYYIQKNLDYDDPNKSFVKLVFINPVIYSSPQIFHIYDYSNYNNAERLNLELISDETKYKNNLFVFTPIRD